jgi:hypothetical protein
MMAAEVMNLPVAASALICLIFGICFWLLIRSSRLAAGRLPVTTDWLDDLAPERYRPMLRLLDEEDVRFLRKQPGFTPQMAAQFRAQRCQILREYLRSIQVDFVRICTALKIVMAQSRQDRSDLASALLRSQITFTCAMAAVQVRLLLYRWGFGKVEVTSLLKVFDGMRLELRMFVPAKAPARAWGPGLAQG